MIYLYIYIYSSAGIGRTGTLIALDILLDQMDAEGAVDIKQCVTQLRQQRTQMVQTVVSILCPSEQRIIYFKHIVSKQLQ